MSPSFQNVFLAVRDNGFNMETKRHHEDIQLCSPWIHLQWHIPLVLTFYGSRHQRVIFYFFNKIQTGNYFFKLSLLVYCRCIIMEIKYIKCSSTTMWTNIQKIYCVYLMYAIFIISIGHKKSFLSDNHYFVSVKLRERQRI